KGFVRVAQYEHEIAEMEALADTIVALHRDRWIAWHEYAVLCRTHRLFEPLQVALADRGVPAEFIGLAGLIKLPEVGELLQRLRERAPEDLDLVEDQPFLIAEALEHLDEVEGLSPEGRARIEEFTRELAELRTAVRRPVGEFLAEIIRRIGLLEELDAHPDPAVASVRKRNLAAFLDQVHAFQPVDGELTLGSFLAYLDGIEDDREWTPVQPSEDDTVKVMTVHAAKGLEFDTVFVPGLAKNLFPDERIQQNPMRRGSSLDIELRRDRDLLPRFDGVMNRFVDALRDQETFEER